MQENPDSLIHDWNLGAELPPKPARKIELNDETLRDGLQSPSVVDPQLEQKIEILHLMCEIGLDAADIGLPGAGPHVQKTVERLAR
ncbi:MAG: 2-isopropylmalate synthase, partial [Acidobacteria bacterium]|nr:2-isopropylmalate synthase [Acidobacteriota bacterium]